MQVPNLISIFFIDLAVLVTISVLGVTAIVLSQWERFARPEYRTMRAGVFVSLGLSGIIPMLHTIIKNGTEGKTLVHASLIRECSAQDACRSN